MVHTIEAPVNLYTLASQFKVLAEPNRLLILHLLMEGVQCNCDIAERLGLSLSLISHHLRILREAGLINVERDAIDARWLYYSINRVALGELNATFDAFFDPERVKPRLPIYGPQSLTGDVMGVALAR